MQTNLAINIKISESLDKKSCNKNISKSLLPSYLAYPFHYPCCIFPFSRNCRYSIKKTSTQLQLTYSSCTSKSYCSISDFGIAFGRPKEKHRRSFKQKEFLSAIQVFPTNAIPTNAVYTITRFPLTRFQLTGFPLMRFTLTVFPLTGFPLTVFPLTVFPLTGFPLMGFPLMRFPPQRIGQRDGSSAKLTIQMFFFKPFFSEVS